MAATVMRGKLAARNLCYGKDMRQRAKFVGAALTFGATFVLQGGHFRGVLDALLIPKQAQDALVMIASAGSWATVTISCALLALGMICVGYILYEDLPKAVNAVKGFKVQFLIPIGIGLVAAGIVLIFIGWLVSEPRASATEKTAPKVPSNAAVSPPLLPDISWDFERPGWGRFGFLSLARSARQDQTVWVKAFQAQGYNNTDGPILNISGTVRSDLNNKEIPVNFLIGSENVKPENTYGIPRGAAFFLQSDRFSPDTTLGLNREEFLAQFGAFTFEFNFDSKKYVKHFSLSESKDLISKFVADLDRAVPQAPPMVTKRN